MRTISFLALILNVLIATAQSEWQNYTAIDNIQEIEIYEGKAYVANSGGLLIIDLATGNEELLSPSNSTFEGYASEIEFLSNGHAWIVSSGNLLYYDGESFEPFEEPDSIDIKRPKSLIVYDDELWFLDFHGELLSIKDMVVTDHSAAFPDDIKYFDLDSQGNVWALNKKDIYEYDGSNILSVTEIYPGDDLFRLDAFYIDDRDVLLMSVLTKSSFDLELVYIDNQDWKVLKTHYVIKTFFEHDSLGVCFNRGKGFGYFIEEDSLGYMHFDSLFTDIPWGDVNRAKFKIWEDSGAWFTGSDLKKPMIHRYVEGQLYTYGHNNIFLGEISEIKANCNDILFKAGETILEKFKDDKWEAVYPNYTDETCIIERLEMNTFNCELWGYGRPNGDIGCNTIWRFTENEIIESYVLDFGILEMAFGPNGNLYTLSYGNKLNLIEPSGQILPIEIDSTIFFSDIFVSADGDIWVLGTDFTNSCNISNTFYVGDGDGEWVKYPQETTQIRTGSSCNIFEDDSGDLWFESINSLVQFDGTTWTNHPLNFGSLGFNEVLMDESGNFWVATREMGLVYWNREDFTFYNTENSNIFSDACISLERVGNDIWVEHNYGLSRMKIDGLSSIEAQSSTISNPTFTLFPNPTYGPFNVKSEGSQERKFDIYSITGKHILSEVSDQSLWSSSLEKGIYLVKITTTNGEFVEKLIVL